jgi:hypothetical protein
VEDRFSTIERQFENFIARTVEPQLSAVEEQTQGIVCELPVVSNKQVYLLMLWATH